MPENRTIFGLLALAAALFVGFSSPARAEFFGCKDDRGRVLSSWTTTSSGPSSAHSSSAYHGRNYSRWQPPHAPRRSVAPRRYSRDFASQPSRYRVSAHRGYRW